MPDLEPVADAIVIDGSALANALAARALKLSVSMPNKMLFMQLRRMLLQ